MKPHLKSPSTQSYVTIWSKLGRENKLCFPCFLILLLASATRWLPAQQPTTWWPDPNSGVMWTGTVTLPRANLNFEQAQARCAGVTIGGYSGWRLPTLAEVDSATGSDTVYGTVVVGSGRRNVAPTDEINYSDPRPSSNLKFNSFSLWPIWTSTSAGQDKVYVQLWTPPGRTYAAGVTERGVSTGYAQAFCVRPMEPDLLQLAKDAHPPSPVTGIPQLKSIALLVQAEDALAQDQFSDAVSFAKQGLALDPKSIRALDDIGMASAYAGNWADALSNLQAAKTLDKYFTATTDDLKWVEGAQKEVAADPNALHAWVLVHDADVAQDAKRYEDAISAANQVIALEPDWPEGPDRLGLALGGLDQWQDAITALTKAVSLDKHHETNAKQDLKNAETIEKKKRK